MYKILIKTIASSPICNSASVVQDIVEFDTKRAAEIAASRINGDSIRPGVYHGCDSDKVRTITVAIALF